MKTEEAIEQIREGQRRIALGGMSEEAVIQSLARIFGGKPREEQIVLTEPRIEETRKDSRIAPEEPYELL